MCGYKKSFFLIGNSELSDESTVKNRYPEALARQSVTLKSHVINLNCNFELNFCGFFGNNWYRTSGSTPSSNTGPSGDYDTGI